MNLRFRLAAGVAFFFLLAFAPPAFACSCRDPGPPCQAYWKSPVVFMGTPLGASAVEVDWRGHKMVQRLFRFRVEEGLRGIRVKEVKVLTGAWGGDCGYDFRVGTKYLVYAHEVEGKPWVGTSICSRTRPLSEAAEDLSFIRGISNSPPGSLLYGVARRYRINLETGGWDAQEPIAGAKVIATSGEHQRVESTDADGNYHFKELPPGKYTVRVILPPNLSSQAEQEVEVSEHGCARIDYRAVLDGRISGKVIDARGQSPGIVTVDLLPLETGKQLRALWDVTESDGSFGFKDLPPGQYVLGVNIGDAPDDDLPYKTTYYPSTSEQGAAEIFKLDRGQHLTGLEFRLPPPLNRRAITGVVVRPDGKPVTRGEVSLTEVASNRPAGRDAKTDGEGRFSIQAFEGVRYKVSASVPADPNWDPDSGQGVELLVSPELEITVSAQSMPVRLVIAGRDGVNRTTFVRRAPRVSSRPGRRGKR